MRGVGGIALGAFVGLVVLALALFAFAPVASADITFCQPQGSGAGECDAPSAAAVHGQSSEVFVADERGLFQNNRVDVFSVGGAFLRAFGWDVIPLGGAGDTGAGLETCTTLSGCKAGSSGNGTGQFERPTAIAVDSACATHEPPLTELTSPTCAEFDPADGDVYVFDEIQKRVQRFHPGGAFVSSFTGGFDENAKLAVGPSGEVLVGDRNQVQIFDSEGSLLNACAAITTGNVTALAVGKDGSFWSLSGGKVRKYDASCNPLATIEPFPGAENVTAIAVDPGGDLFIAEHSENDEGGRTAIYEYNPAGAPIHALYGNGTLQGNPISLAYYSDSTGDLFVVDAASPRRVAHIKIEPPGPVVLPFAAQAGPSQSVGTGTRATGVGNIRATLKARVNPEGKASTVGFEYVDEAAYEKDIGEGGDGFAEAFESGPGKTTPASIPANFTSQSDIKATDTSFAIPCPEPEVELAKKLEEGKCLAAETKYRFRAVASNADGTDVGPVASFETLPPIQLGPVFSTGVSAESARLHAELNPTGIPSSAHFEFVSETAYEKDIEEGGDGFAEAIKTPEIAFGSGNEAVAHSALIFPLSPETTYRFRYLAHDLFGDFPSPVRSLTTTPAVLGSPPCANDALRSGPAANLPDCRAYELVTPVDKDGGDAIAPREPFATALLNTLARVDQAAAGGDALAYAVFHAFGDPQSAPLASQYIARRNAAAGWVSQPVNAPRSGPSLISGESAVTASLFTAFSEDLCSAWFMQDTDLALAPGAPAGVPNIYRRANCGAEGDELLSTVAPPGFGKEIENRSLLNIALGGFSADGSVSAFRSPAALTPEARTVSVGSVLKCEVSVPGAEKVEFKWLRNGLPIVGTTTVKETEKPGLPIVDVSTAEYKTSPTSTTTPASTVGDAGGSIQCQATASNKAAGAIQTSNPAFVVAPFPATAPPIAPPLIPAPSTSSPLSVGGGVGQTLTCDPHEAGWEGLPLSFEYQWYRNGVKKAGATSPTYVTTGTDLNTAAAFQCVVSGKNAEGGRVSQASAVLLTEPAPRHEEEIEEQLVVEVTPYPEPHVGRTNRVYLHDASGLHLVSVLPNGEAAMSGAAVGTAITPSDLRFFGSSQDAVSADGAQVFWSAQIEGGGASHIPPSKLYLRINAAQPQSALSGEECSEPQAACTIAISAGAAIFRGANPEGTKALFTEGEKLFEVDVDKAIAHEAGAQREIAGGVKGLMGMSNDLGRAYFVSSEDLDEGAEAGAFNLYLEEAGGGITFVARLLGDGWRSDPQPNDPASSDVLSISPFPVDRSSRVSGDGLHVAFMSNSTALAEEVAGYDNSDANSGEADSEVYLYDAGEGKLRCVSCNPGGGRPEGKSLKEVGDDEVAWTAAQIPGWETNWHASRLLAGDGERLFFESFEGLVARDTNQKQDVYEWELAQTKAQCEEMEMGAERYSPKAEGCLSLISSGKGAADAEVLDASASGKDIFFATVSSLVPQDPGLFDVYDAREGGGFAASGGGVPECEGEACQSPPPPPPPLNPASAATEGQGNVPAPAKPRCPKGKHQVRQGGKTRCVPKPSKKRHRARHHRRAAR